MIQTRYRRDYDGEFVILETRYAQGRKEQKREWVPNPIENHHLSGRAAVIGSDCDLELFDFPRLQYHKGGLLGKKRLQTYGSGDLWRKMRFDFLVETDISELQLIKQAQYNESNIVYTTGKNCIQMPGEFYLVPYVTRRDPLALAPYLAAFDGHREIFMLGYTNDTLGREKNWHEQVDEVIKSYDTTDFIFVGVEANIPLIWRANRNAKIMSYRDWISYCDV